MLRNDTTNQLVRNVTLSKLSEQLDSLQEALKRSSTVDGELSTNHTCSLRGFVKLTSIPAPNEYTETEDDSNAFKMLVDSVIYSPECGLLLTSKLGVGLTTPLIASGGQMLALLVSVVAVLQILATIKQMEAYSTPSALGRISHVTLAMQIILDIAMCLTLLTAAITNALLFTSFIAASFLSFVLFSIYELRYGVDILSQRMTLDETSFVRSYLYSAVVFMVLYQIAAQVVIVGLISSVLLNLFWIPQIVRNYRKNTRKGLSWGYVGVISVTRVVVPVYVLGVKESLVGFGEVYPGTLCVVVVGVLVQVCVLGLQARLGPRWFVPKRLQPVVYNYHPILTEDLESLPNPTLNTECAICFAEVDTRDTCTDYMITPCHHVFHQECLEKWMDVKLECPVCRAGLPVA